MTLKIMKILTKSFKLNLHKIFKKFSSSTFPPYAQLNLISFESEKRRISLN